MGYRILHISDLHLGKNLHGFSLKEDQKYTLDHILHMIDAERITTLLIAGDIFDRTDPPEYALDLFDSFLTQLADKNVQTVVISGNHDSRRRLAYASHLLKRCGIHVVTSYPESLEPVVLHKHAGAGGEISPAAPDSLQVNVWPVPYLYPADIKSYVSADVQISTPQHMFAFVKDQIVSHPQFKNAVNILMMHQSVAGSSEPPALSDSERHERGYLGTIEFVESSLFQDFDYVALGHIHRPQQVGSPLIRYSGSLCMYSFSEMNYPKSAVMLDIVKTHSSQGADDLTGSTAVTLSQEDLPEGSVAHVVDVSCKQVGASLSVTTHPLAQKKPFLQRTGTLAEIVERARAECEDERDAYVKVTLTDNDEPIGALETLRLWYPSVMLVEYDNARTRALTAPVSLEAPEALTQDLFELFEQFYAQQNGDELDDKKARIVRAALTSDHERSGGLL